MKNNILKRFAGLFIFSMVFMGGFAIAEYSYAQVPGDPTDNTETVSQEKLLNPLAGAQIDDIPKFVKKIFDIVLTIGVPIVALMIIFTGFMFVQAQGNPTALEKAKQAFTWVIIGSAILLGSWVIANAISGTVQEIINISEEK